MKTNKKIVIIVGGSGGIGNAVAKKLDKEGFLTVLASRSLKKLSLSRIGFKTRPIIIPTDITKEKQVIRLFQKVMDKFGRCDALVNCAGSLYFKKCVDMVSKDFNDFVSTNFSGFFLCMREYMRQVKNKKMEGQIINISSVAAKMAIPKRSLYCAIKEAIGIFSKSVSAELSNDERIKICTIYAGLVATDVIKEAKSRDPQELVENALKPMDVAYIVNAVINQGRNSNISEIILHPLFPVGHRKRS